MSEAADRAYPGWLVIVSKSGSVELSPGDDHVSLGAPTPPLPELMHQGTCSALFDGVLYNRAELERRLGLEGSTDGELAVAAYLRWGKEAPSELNGIYALVVGDKAGGRVMCARDRIGWYPLFYVDAGDELLLSTSIDALLRDPRVSGELNRAALADHLAHRWPDPGETYFTTIRRLPAGHSLVAERGIVRINRYWSPVPADGDIDWVAEDELVEFEALLSRAITRFLELGPTGIYLSGGLDSVSVAAMAASMSREMGLPAPWALSLGFSHPVTNEQAIQRQVAADLDLPQLLIPLEEASGPEGLMAASLELNGRWPAPLVNTWLPAYIHLAVQGREHGVRTILTGHGGDEWLTVTPYLAADLILSLDPKGLLRLWENQRRSYPIPARTLLRNLLWRFGARPLLGLAAHRLAPGIADARRRRRRIENTPEWIAPDPKLRDELAARTEASISDRPEPGQIYLSEMARGLDHPLVAMELEETFESNRRLGLRIGYPFWDADLLTFLYRTPPELLNQGGRSKGLVRGMLARRFPELGFERQRKVTGTPVMRAIQVVEGRDAWRRIAGPTALTELGVVDGAAASALVEGLLNDRKPPEEIMHSYRVWDILSLETWARSHL